MAKNLIVITGATASGKTDRAIELAEQLGCDIISADSRQMYKDIPIGAAAPSPQQLAKVRHHFIGTLPLDSYYSAAQYETDVMRLLPELFKKNDNVVMCGGSMMYIDAVCRGIDELPTISEKVRTHTQAIYEKEGLEGIRQRLAALDPEIMHRVDPQNPRRNIHALEICLQAGVPASSLLTGKIKERPFNITKYYIDMPRQILFDRINRRVLAMMEQGLEQEARGLHHLRHLNALNTVGYKEMFAYFDGVFTLDQAVARIQKNTRVYAKKQLTWLKRDTSAIPLPVFLP